MRAPLAASLALVALLSLVVAVSAAPHKVTSLPGWNGSLADEMYTGYLPVSDAAGSSIFYWLSLARKPAPGAAYNTPVVLWLQGGPGCSGGLGWFYENGPYNLQADGSLVRNEYSWSENAHFLFVDQPIGTGLSTLPPGADANATYARTIDESTTHLYNALQHFFLNDFPDLMAHPFYITGESYAGKYIPNLATAILQGQFQFTLQVMGIAIGNGWVDPLTQTSVYGDQAYYLGLIDARGKADVDTAFAQCSKLVAAQQWQQAQQVCDDLLNNLVVARAGGINVDDVREFGSDEPDDRLETYLSSPAVQKALGLVNPPKAYESCSMAAGVALSEDEMQPAVQLMPYLVRNIKQVLIYEGIFDMNCGAAGAEKWISNTFPSLVSSAPRYLWLDDSGDQSVSGYVTPLAPGFNLVVVQDAGHMVPKTQPARAADMITRFLKGEAYPKHVLPTVATKGLTRAERMQERKEARRANQAQQAKPQQVQQQPRIILRED